MYCPHCERDLPDGVQACDSCGGTVTVYGPPDGFLWDAESGLFYRDEAYVPGDTEQWVTWFHPNAGEYKQVSYQLEAGQAPMPPSPPVQTPGPPAAPPSPPAQAPGAPPAPPASVYYGDVPDFMQKKRGGKKLAFIIPLAFVVLLGLAAGGHFLGFYQLPLLPEAKEGGVTAASNPTGTPGVITAAPSPTLTREPSAAAPASTPYPLPESLSLSQLDPYDMLHNGMTLTKEQAAAQYGFEVSSARTYASGELAQAFPGTQSCSVTAGYEYIYRGRDFEDFEYTYSLDEAMSLEDAVRLFRLAAAAMDEAFSGRNKLWDEDLRDAGISADTSSDQEIAEFFTGRNKLICYWGVSLGGAWYERPCVASVELVPGFLSASELKVRFWYSFDLFTKKEYLRYFPDENAAEIPAALHE